MKFKELFFGHYPPSEADFSEWWKTGIFVFDANALLDLYSLEETTRTELFTFLESVRVRVWVPHRAGFEFHKNRIGVIKQQVNKYKDALEKLERLIPAMRESAENAQKHLDAPEAVKAVASRVASSFDDLFVKINEGTDSISASVELLCQELKTARDGQEALITNDPILAHLTKLLGENVGDEYDEKRLKDIYAEGTIRYSADPPIPPGYMDEKNKKNNDKFGDLVVWYQTIDKAKEACLPVIMVNSEQKPDWVASWSGGKRVRTELVQEMYQKANSPFCMYSLTQFMKAAKTYLGASFSTTSISDASRVEQAEDKIASEQVSDAQDIFPSPLLRFDGVYRSEAFVTTTNRTAWTYFRFYEDATVLSAASTASPEEMIDIFRGESKWILRGKYSLTENILRFSVANNMGAIDYVGIITGASLRLDFYSHINNKASTLDFYFFKTDPRLSSLIPHDKAL